jgi:hypothetical protein
MLELSDNMYINEDNVTHIMFIRGDAYIFFNGNQDKGSAVFITDTYEKERLRNWLNMVVEKSK